MSSGRAPIAVQLGHEDDGALVRKLYGHRDRGLALRSIESAFDRVNCERKAA